MASEVLAEDGVVWLEDATANILEVLGKTPPQNCEHAQERVGCIVDTTARMSSSVRNGTGSALRQLYSRCEQIGPVEILPVLKIRNGFEQLRRQR